jgi:hypothetical protein
VLVSTSIEENLDEVESDVFDGIVECPAKERVEFVHVSTSGDEESHGLPGVERGLEERTSTAQAHRARGLSREEKGLGGGG